MKFTRFDAHVLAANTLALRALETGWFRLDQVEARLASGRVFRYSMRNHPCRVDATQAELDAIAGEVVREKYVYCDWDDDHPTNDSRSEIYACVRAWMMDHVARARKLAARRMEPKS